MRFCTNYRAGVSDCLKALSDANGDMEAAKEILAEQGLAETEKVVFPFFPPKETPSKWAYLVKKAEIYLKKGPDIYRREDAFGMPDPEWDEDILHEISSCFEQLCDGKGFSREDPVQNVSVEGFYAAMSTLHFEAVRQSAYFVEDSDAILDAIEFRHMVDGREITLFNNVRYPDEMGEEE